MDVVTPGNLNGNHFNIGTDVPGSITINIGSAVLGTTLGQPTTPPLATEPVIRVDASTNPSTIWVWDGASWETTEQEIVPIFETVDDMLTDVMYTYDNSYDVAQADGYSYARAPLVVTDEDFTTAGGVKLYAIPGDSGAFDVEQFNGGVGKTGAENAVASNAMYAAKDRRQLAGLGACQARYSYSGMYDHDIGFAPTIAGRVGREGCVYMGVGTVSTYVAPGAHVRMADNQQTDGGGPADLFFADIDLVTSFTMICDGFVDNNFLGQSGWTGGFTQAAASGTAIWVKGDQPRGRYYFDGAGRIGGCYSNPINIGGDSVQGGSIHFGDVEFVDGGEGPEYIGFSRVTGKGQYRLENFHAMAGDGIEPARCGTVDYDSVHIEASLGDDLAIEAVTLADPVLIQITNHGMADDDALFVPDGGDTVELTDNTYVVTVIDPDTLALRAARNGADVDGTGFTPYVSGGVVNRIGLVSGGALEVFGCDEVRVGTLTALHANTLISVSGPNGGLQAGVQPSVSIGKIYARNLTGSQAIIVAPDNPNMVSIGPGTIEDSPSVGAFFIDSDDPDPEPVRLRNVTFKNMSAGALQSDRQLVWHGGGNVDSNNFGFSLQGLAADPGTTIRNIDWRDLDFSGAANGNRANTPSGSTLAIRGVMSGCSVGAFDEWPGVDTDVDYTGLEVVGCKPDFVVTDTKNINCAFARTIVDIDAITDSLWLDFRNPSKNAEIRVINRRGVGLVTTFVHNAGTAGTSIFNKSGADDTIAFMESRQYRHYSTADAPGGVAGWYEV